MTHGDMVAGMGEDAARGPREADLGSHERAERYMTCVHIALANLPAQQHAPFLAGAILAADLHNLRDFAALLRAEREVSDAG